LVNGTESGEDMRAVLLAVRESALLLAGGFAHPPASLRLQAGDVVVEVAWAVEAGFTPADPRVNGHGSAVPSDGGDGADGANAGTGTAAGLTIHSPMVGRFYRSPEPGAPPFVEVGDVVAVDEQVAIVETMKLMIPVKAEVAGTVAEVLCADGEDVEHGEPLFRLTP
jgi:acetyl-CoA carboxylase biotin carboxyl carrier protein